MFWEFGRGLRIRFLTKARVGFNAAFWSGFCSDVRQRVLRISGEVNNVMERKSKVIYLDEVGAVC